MPFVPLGSLLRPVRVGCFDERAFRFLIESKGLDARSHLTTTSSPHERFSSLLRWLCDVLDQLDLDPDACDGDA